MFIRTRSGRHVTGPCKRKAENHRAATFKKSEVFEPPQSQPLSKHTPGWTKTVYCTLIVSPSSDV